MHLGQAFICAWHEVHTGSTFGRPSSLQPDNSTSTILWLLGGVKLLGKWKRERERKDLNIERNIQMIKFSCTNVKEKDKKLENKQFCKMLFGMTKPDQSVTVLTYLWGPPILLPGTGVSIMRCLWLVNSSEESCSIDLSSRSDSGIVAQPPSWKIQIIF